jgi:hypothetical protein
MQSQAGNRSVGRMIARQRATSRTLARDTEAKPDGPWWQQRVSSVRAAIGRGDFVNYTDSLDTAGAYWNINSLNQDDQAKIMTFLDAASLDALLDYDDDAVAAGVPNAAHIIAEARKARALRTAPIRDPLQVMVRGTWVDDFKAVNYDMDYRISDGGSPSEWIQVFYKDGTTIDLNWYDFEDAKLPPDDMKYALEHRFLGDGGRVFPGRKPTGPGRAGYTPRYALTQQLCPRLWAVHKDVEEIGAQSTIELMTLSLTAVMFVITAVAGSISRPLEESTVKVTRRSVPKAGLSSTQMRARQLVQNLKSEGKDVVVNVGGAGASHEPPNAINLNNQAVARKNIPNLVEADGSEIGNLFESGTVDKVEGHNMAPGAVNWDRAAPGAFRVLKSNGRLSYYYRGANADAAAAEQALRSAGFKDVKNMGNVYLTATKP